MKHAAQVIQQWPWGRIALLWLAAAFATVLLLTWQDTLSKRPREIKEQLLSWSPENPYIAAALRVERMSALQAKQRADHPGEPLDFSDLVESPRIHALRRYVGADTALWFDSGPKIGTPEQVYDKKREVWNRLSRSVQRDEALASGITVVMLGILPLTMLSITWTWFGGRQRALAIQPRRSIRDWHPGKLVVLWCVTFGVLYGLIAAFPFWERAEALILWAVLASPVVVITWKWLSGRERAGD